MPQIVPISKNVVQLMQNRLEEAENSVLQLTQEIMTARQHGSTDRYSVLLSKAQSMGTILQSLKLNIVNLSTLTRQPSELEQKIVEVTDLYADELKKLSNETANLKADKLELQGKREQAELELQKTKLSLEETVQLMALKEDELNLERSRSEELKVKIRELSDKLSEEKHLRFGLDRANNGLAVRLDEMEHLLKQEHQETESLSKEFLRLKKEMGHSESLLKQERENNKVMESETIAVCQELELRLQQLEEMRLERDEHAKQINTIHKQYSELNKQLEAMQHLFNKHQVEKEELKVECEKLQSKVDDLQVENSAVRTEILQMKNNDESAKVIELRKKLSQTCKSNDLLSEQNQVLNEKIGEMQEKLNKMVIEATKKQETSVKVTEGHMSTIEDLNDRLQSLKSELLTLEVDKDQLLNQVSGAAEVMQEERDALQGEIDSYHQQLLEEKEKRENLEKQLQAKGNSHFDKRIAELTNQKNALAYENGKLQIQVEQLQMQVSELSEQPSLQHALVDAERKVKKCKKEVETYKQRLIQSETMIEQLQSMSDAREADYNSALKSRDEAISDAKALTSRIIALESVIKTQEEQRQEIEARMTEENSTLAFSLENMMATHTDLQCRYEALQIELGKKDEKLSDAARERKNLVSQVTQAREKSSSSEERLLALEDKQNSKMKALEKEMKSIKSDNSRLAKALLEATELNEVLKAQNEENLLKLKSECDTLTSKWKEKENQLQKETTKNKALVEEMESKLTMERDNVYGKMAQQMKAVQQETEKILEKNGQLISENSELKSEINALKTDIDSLKTRCNLINQKYGEARKSLKEKTKAASAATDFEKINVKLQTEKEELTRLCEQKQNTIDRFIHQLKELQSEMRNLVQLHTAQSQAFQEKNQQLEAQEKANSELRGQLTEAMNTIIRLKSVHHATERDVIYESALKNSEAWINSDTYSERISEMTNQLSAARKQMSDAELIKREKEYQIALEKRRSEELTNTAAKMIQEARKSVTRLADQAHLDVSLREKSLENSTMTATARSHDSRNVDTSLGVILGLEGRDNVSLNLSPFTSSSQKLDTIIREMERRRLIT